MGSLLRVVGLLFLVSVNAEDRWAWSGRGDESTKINDRYNVRSDVIAYQRAPETSDRIQDTLLERRGRYEVKETTTKRPGARPQNNEFSGEFEEGTPSNDLGINQKFDGVGGPNSGQLGPNPYGINPGFVGTGAFPFQGSNSLGGGYFPGQHYGPVYGGLGGHLPANGILVGPSGPTGIIGRPYNRFPFAQAGHHPGGNGFFNGGFGNSPFAGQPGGISPGFYSPGGIFPQQEPFGYSGPRPFGSLRNKPLFGSQFEPVYQANKKVEKRASR